jgi:hypothetical protein
MVFVFLVIAVVTIVGMWKVFTKAGEPGWAVLIPIYNTYVMLKIAGKPWWWLLLMFVPIVSIVIAIMAMVALAARFGKGAGFALGMILLPFVFIPMLGFGSAQYTPAPAAA